MVAPTLTQITPDQVQSFAYDPVEPRALEDARKIVNDVKACGENGLRNHAMRLGDIASLDQTIIISKKELIEAFNKLAEKEQQVLARTVARIRVFAQSQRDSIKNFQQKIEGGFAGQDVSSIEFISRFLC
jgi:histidinol dehydrogenase